MTWWLWILVGLGFLAAETLTPGGFYVFFFGVAAILVGLLTWMGIAGSESFQWLLFSVFSVASVLLLRPRLVGRFSESSSGAGSRPELVGDTAVLLEDLEPGSVAKAELRGTSWSVRSHEAPLPSGTRCTVKRVEGLTLWVVPSKGER